MSFQNTDRENALCFSEADILLPKQNMEKFAVIACDQFTSEPGYWEKVRDFTAGYNTAYELILPEIYLKDDNRDAIRRINSNMEKYLREGAFNEIKDSFIFVRRLQSDGIIREGLIGKIDLREYSYLPGGSGKIRSTEKTVIERIPPRAETRRGAPIELPHVMLLFDDESDGVMKYLEGRKEEFEKLYGFELFGGSGSIEGYRLDVSAKEQVKKLLKETEQKNDGLLFCVGDGNHSLAAAKSIYEQSKSECDRYALVEIVNIHSPAINFEPIYRVLFDVDPDKTADGFIRYCEKKGGRYRHDFSCVYKGGKREFSVLSDFSLPVAALQDFLDSEMPKVKIDYIHGIDSTVNIATSAENRVGFIFDGMKKSELFSAVIKDGALPRKTFSMGHALDKRFYLEGRKIGNRG